MPLRVRYMSNIDIPKLIEDKKDEYGELINRAFITFKLVLEGPIHVGVGGREFYSPSLKIRSLSGTEYLYIPEQSVRGVLRKISEWLAKSSPNMFPQPEDQLVKVHVEPEGDIIRHLNIPNIVNSIARKGNEGLLKEFIPDEEVDYVIEKVTKNEASDEILKKLEPMLAMLCPICRLWGAPGLRSKVIIKDVLIKGFKVHPYTRVSIDRRSNTQMPGRLFSIEKIYIDSINVEMIVNNVVPKSSEALILATLIEYIDKVGISIGGMKSIGFGHAKLDKQGSQVTYVDYRSVCSGTNKSNECIDILINPKEKGIKLSIDEYVKLLRGR